MMKDTVNVASKFNRCVEVTLPTGQVIVAKVLGEKAEAAANTRILVSALTTAGSK